MSSCYSPVMPYTPQVLDAAIRTANAVHSLSPFDFAIIDPEVAANPPAAVSRGYIVGAERIFGALCTSLTYSYSYVHDAELLKLLLSALQAKDGSYGRPLGHPVAIDRTEKGAVINFLGRLLSAGSLSGPWGYFTDVAPYAVTAAHAAKYHRAAE